MYTFAWPLSGIFMCGIAAILGEMASTYPVAGTFFLSTSSGSSADAKFRSRRRHVYLDLSNLPQLKTSRLLGSLRILDCWIVPPLFARFDSSASFSPSLAIPRLTLQQIIITYQLAGMILGVVALHLTGFEPSFWKRIGICWVRAWSPSHTFLRR